MTMFFSIIYGRTKWNVIFSALNFVGYSITDSKLLFQTNFQIFNFGKLMNIAEMHAKAKVKVNTPQPLAPCSKKTVISLIKDTDKSAI